MSHLFDKNYEKRTKYMIMYFSEKESLDIILTIRYNELIKYNGASQSPYTVIKIHRK